MKIILQLFGWALLGVSLVTGLWFFYVHERVLFIVPQLAERTTIQDLLNNSNAHAERWVRLEGKVLRKSTTEAFLVPAEIDLEGLPPADGSGKDKGLQTENILTSLPDRYVFMHDVSPFGISTVDFDEIEPGRTVEVVAEFELKRFYDLPHLDVVATLKPRQNRFWRPIGFSLGVFTSAIFVCGVFLSLGRKKAGPS